MLKLILEVEMEIEALQRKMDPEEKRSESVKKLVEDLRGGRKVTDFRFDQVYPPSIRKLSETHQNDRPCSAVGSFRIRLTNTASSPAHSTGVT